MNEDIRRALMTFVFEARGSVAFFASLATTREYILSDAVPTLAIKGKKVWVNPSFFNKLEPKERIACIAHEVAHEAFGHSFRSVGKDHRLSNIAGDLAINSILAETGLKLPALALLPGQGTYSDYPWNKPMEWYYEKLKENEEKEPKPQPSKSLSSKTKEKSKEKVEKLTEDSADPGNMGSFLPFDPENQNENEETNLDIQVSLQRFESIAPGSISIEMRDNIRNRTTTKRNWKRLMEQWLTTTLPNDDKSWDRVSRRSPSTGIYFAGHAEEIAPHLVVAIDTSGSISPADLTTFMSELTSLRKYHKHKLTLIWHHHSIYHEQLWEKPGLPPQPQIQSGGTSHNPVFERAAIISPDAIICLTDLYTSFPENKPRFPVLWLSPDGAPNPPWGKRLSLALINN